MCSVGGSEGKEVCSICGMVGAVCSRSAFGWICTWEIFAAENIGRLDQNAGTPLFSDIGNSVLDCNA